MFGEIGITITAKAGRWLPSDLGCDGQTAKQMHPLGNPLHLDHVPPQNPSERLTSQWLCQITHFSLQPQDILVNETAKLSIEVLTPEAGATSTYFTIQDAYL